MSSKINGFIEKRLKHVREARKYLKKAGLVEGSYEWRQHFRQYLDSVGIPAPKPAGDKK